MTGAFIAAAALAAQPTLYAGPIVRVDCNARVLLIRDAVNPGVMRAIDIRDGVTEGSLHLDAADLDRRLVGEWRVNQWKAYAGGWCVPGPNYYAGHRVLTPREHPTEGPIGINVTLVQQ